MTLVAFDGSPLARVGIGRHANYTGPTAGNLMTADAAAEAGIWVGQVHIVGGGTKTLDTSASSSLKFRLSGSTFANGSTVVAIGLAAPDTGTGGPARATNVADVITFDVSAVLTGGGGGLTTTAWNTVVPTTGSKSVTHGDLVAFAIQMTARGGADSVVAQGGSLSSTCHRPAATNFQGGSYTAAAVAPNVIITFSDGTLGYFVGSDIFSVYTTRTWNSGSATKEYGQLFKDPFPHGIYGAYGWYNPSGDCDIVLYSDPLGGSPVAERTVSLDANTVVGASQRYFEVMFATPYESTADQVVAAVYKPGGSNVSVQYKTLATATHRVADMGGTDSYGISRASGAFADANSSLDHYAIGLFVGSFDNGAGAGGGSNNLMTGLAR